VLCESVFLIQLLKTDTLMLENKGDEVAQREREEIYQTFGWNTLQEGTP